MLSRLFVPMSPAASVHFGKKDPPEKLRWIFLVFRRPMGPVVLTYFFWFFFLLLT